ncbi:MAG: hypothetical protein Kow0090_18450 [Myxococcota bacterium]
MSYSGVFASILLFLSVSICAPAFGGETKSGEMTKSPVLSSDEPTVTDYALTYNGVGALILLELFKNKLASEEATIKAPNAFDKAVRTSLKWHDAYLISASRMSDTLLYFFFIPSIFWSPLLTKNDYRAHSEIILEATVLTGLITQAAKFSLPRERPYAHYSTLAKIGGDDNLSFFSGHTSISFAIATSSSYILSKAHPENAPYYWSASLALALLTGYLRIASDRHYASDVLVGAAVGTLTGYLVAKSRFKQWAVYPTSGERFLFSVGFAF